MSNKIIMQSIYGSHLYGTNNENSDRDIKQIHILPTDVLLTGKYSGCFNYSTNTKGKNTSTDVDFESKELRHYIKEALGGQTYALDLLFTPQSLIIEKDEVWDEIIEFRSKLVSNNITPFVGYVNSQASKYSNKGEKILELDQFLAQLRTNDVLTLGMNLEELERAISTNGLKGPVSRSGLTLREVIENMNISEMKYFSVKDYVHYGKSLGKNSEGVEMFEPDRVEPYLYGPNCSFPLSRKFTEVFPVLLEKRKAFGRRAEEASKNGGLDLKAYYHALRIIWQLEDYLTTGKMEFPSPRVQHLRDIRAGKYDREYIEEWIATEIDRVTQIPNTLPDADYAFWEDWLTVKYMKQAYKESRKYLRMKGLIK